MESVTKYHFPLVVIVTELLVNEELTDAKEYELERKRERALQSEISDESSPNPPQGDDAGEDTPANPNPNQRNTGNGRIVIWKSDELVESTSPIPIETIIRSNRKILTVKR